MLAQLTDNVWVADMPQSFYGLQFGARMTIVRLSDGSLFMHSPITIDDAMKSDIDALGPVAHIIAPNIYHHVSAKPASELYPEAKVHVAPGLDKKRSDLRADAILGAAPDPGWHGDPYCVYGCVRRNPPGAVLCLLFSLGQREPAPECHRRRSAERALRAAPGPGAAAARAACGTSPGA